MHIASALFKPWDMHQKSSIALSTRSHSYGSLWRDVETVVKVKNWVHFSMSELVEESVKSSCVSLLNWSGLLKPLLLSCLERWMSSRVPVPGDTAFRQRFSRIWQWCDAPILVRPHVSVATPGKCGSNGIRKRLKCKIKIARTSW